MIHSAWGVIIACGKDQQVTSDSDFAFLSVDSRPLLTYSLDAYEQCSEIDGIIVVATKDRLQTVQGIAQMYSFSKLRKIVAGTTQRRSSLANGLKQLDPEVTIVSVHDATRPCITPELVAESIKAAKRYGTGIVASKMTDPVKEVEKGQKVSGSLDYTKLWCVESPQTYKSELLLKAMATDGGKDAPSDDESALVATFSKEVHLVPSTSPNIKVNTTEDLIIAEAFLRNFALAT